MHKQANIRSLLHIHNSEAVTDGDGVRIQRNVAHRAPQTFDPFLLLDEIASDDAADYIGGFPEHPHRGFETVTYMLEGRMRHRDHLGNEGLLVSGGVQWMTAGRGVLHSEMPEQESGRLHGFQLWMNLPASEKMQAPNYQDFAPSELPILDLGDAGRVKIIAGSLTLNQQTATGPVTGVTTQPDFFDIQLKAGASLQLPVDSTKRVLLYVYSGHIQVIGPDDARDLHQHQLGMLGEGDGVEFKAVADSQLLFLAGVPIREPIAQWGPFVMNTHAEIEQAIDDYKHGRLVEAPQLNHS